MYTDYTVRTYMACYNMCKAFTIMLWLCGTKFNEAQVASLYKLLYQPCLYHMYIQIWHGYGGSEALAKPPDIICIIYLVRTYKFSTHTLLDHTISRTNKLKYISVYIYLKYATLVWLEAIMQFMYNRQILAVWIVANGMMKPPYCVYIPIYAGYSMAITI